MTQRPLDRITDEQRLAEHRCTECFRGPPEATFCVDRGLPEAVCSECKSRAAVQGMVDRNAVDNQAAMTQFVRATISQSVSVPAIRDIASGLVTRFGGISDLTDQLYLHIRQVLDQKPGSRQAIDVLKFVIRLIERGLAEQRVDMDISSLTDDQLDNLVGRFLRDRFGMAIPGPDSNGNGKKQQ